MKKIKPLKNNMCGSEAMVRLNELICQHNIMLESLKDFDQMNFWQRLKWLFTGNY